jgi:hypothetical protein
MAAEELPRPKRLRGDSSFAREALTVSANR